MSHKHIPWLQVHDVHDPHDAIDPPGATRVSEACDVGRGISGGGKFDGARPFARMASSCSDDGGGAEIDVEMNDHAFAVTKAGHLLKPTIAALKPKTKPFSSTYLQPLAGQNHTTMQAHLR